MTRSPLLAGPFASKTPMSGRFFVALMAVALPVSAATPVPVSAAEPLTVSAETPVSVSAAKPPPVSAAEPLTADEAARRAASRPALGEVVAGTAGAVRAEAQAARVWPNPDVAWAREHTFGSGGAAEDALTVSQRFELSGRRGLIASSIEERARAVEIGAGATRIAIAAQARAQFYELMAARRRAATLGAWVERVGRALHVAQRRETAGESSAFDARRLARELALARAQVGAAQADAARAWGSLRALMGDPGTQEEPPPLAGDLLPPPPAQGEGDAGLATRPDLLAIDAELESARLLDEAASRAWAPDLAIGAGWKGVETDAGRADGYVVMASISLPLFTSAGAEEQMAASTRRAAMARRALLLDEATREAAGRRAELRALIDTVGALRANAAETGALVSLAEAAFLGGEMGILGLLDAQRAALDDGLAIVELELRARRASIDLDLLLGGDAP